MTKEEFKVFYMAMSAFYPNQVREEPEVMKLWFEMLKQMDYRTVSEGLKRWAMDNKWMPTVAEIINFSLPDQMSAAEAWGYIVSFMRKYPENKEIYLNAKNYEDYKNKVDQTRKRIIHDGYEIHDERDKSFGSGIGKEWHYFFNVRHRIPDKVIRSVVEEIGYYTVREACVFYGCMDGESIKQMHIAALEIKSQFEFLYTEMSKNYRANALGLPCQPSAVVRDVLAGGVDFSRLLEDSNGDDYNDDDLNDYDDEDDEYY